VQHVGVNLGEEIHADFLDHTVVVNGAQSYKDIDVQTIKAFVFQPNEQGLAPSGGVMQVAFRT